MARWGVNVSKGSSSVQSVTTLTSTGAGSSRRVRIYDWSIACNATPLDNVYQHVAQRCTTAATGAAVTPNALDQADTLASTTAVTGTVTVDPTLTANAFCYGVSLNQRVSFRWTALPYFELTIPATNGYGFMLGLSAATATTFAYGVEYEEL